VSNSRPTTAEKRQAFRKLHEAGCFVIPNPWNVGTARYLQGLGFKALATTSAGHAHSLGFPDGGQSVDAVLAHYRELADATDVPLNADFENGFADDPDGVAANVTRCIATGVAGLSVEDSPKDARPLYELDAAVARVKARRPDGLLGIHHLSDLRSSLKNLFSSALEMRPSKPSNLPSLAISVAVLMNACMAARASEPPTLMRRTPMAAISLTLNSIAQPARKFTGFGATALTTASICSRVLMPGA
jgi:hypothetical protein